MAWRWCTGAGTRAALQALALAGGYAAADAALFSDLDLSTLSRPPLWEPTLDEYFPNRHAAPEDAASGLPSPVVLTSPSREEFFYHARRGYPIIVSDWSRGMVYDGWTGEDFAREFPFGYMKAEYIHDMDGFDASQHDTKVIDGELRFRMGSFRPDGAAMWYNHSRPASRRYADDPLKPQRGPYVWHVKDELPPEQKRLVQARFRAPSFLSDALNRGWMNRTFEVWFSPGGHAGAGAHADGYCESVVSVQLFGDKRWRKMMLPPMTFFDSFDEFDGGVYEAGRWQPDLGFINREQGAVIWPPGYLHETSTLPSPGGSCGAALTLQYAFPQPVQFIRAFLPRLSLSSEVGQCVVRRWSGYATLFVKGIKPQGSMKQMAEQLDTILRSVDLDGDSQVTVNETRAWLADPSSSAAQDAAGFHGENRELLLQFKAEDAVAYHDMNNDMVASRQEIWDSLVQWNVVRARIVKGLQLVNAADREGLEAFERSLDRFRREPAVFPKRLRPELEDLFSLAKGTRVLRSLRGVHSFSDSEFWSNAREQVQEHMRRQGIHSPRRDEF